MEGPPRYVPYAALIGLLIMGSPVREAQIDKLPDPELFRDAWFLSRRGVWTPSELDAAPEMLIALVQAFQSAVKRD